MRIGLDLDGVCYQWDAAANRALADYDPAALSDLELHQHWGHLDVQVKERLGDEDGTAALKWLWTAGIPAMFGGLGDGSWYPGSAALARWLGNNHELVVITSRPRTAGHLTLRFLAERKINPAEVHILGANQVKSFKPHCDVYIEDRDKNVIDLLDYTQATVLVPRRPWNADMRHIADIADPGREPDRWDRMIPYSSADEVKCIIEQLERGGSHE